MKILACHRFFWPDTPPYASMLRSLASAWAASGHEVEVFSAQPSYRSADKLNKRPWQERLEGFQIRRTWLPFGTRQLFWARGIQAVWFSAAFFLRIAFGPKRDIIVASTFPPILLALCGSLAARLRGASFVYHCQDLHPEVSRTVGGLRNSWLYRMLRAVDHWTCRRSHVVVLSSDMRSTVCSRGSLPREQIHIINNFDLPSFDNGTEEDVMSLVRSAGCLDRRIRIAFLGNIGRFQYLDALVDAIVAADCADRLELLIVGEGVLKNELIARCEKEDISNVCFLPYQSPSVAREIMRVADYGVVSLEPGMYRVAYPSKTMTYLASGCPLLGIVEGDSNLAQFIDEEELGFAVNPSDSQGLAQVILEIAGQGKTNTEKRERCTQAWARNFSFDIVKSKWEQLFLTIVERAPK